ncbi:unnamed protein product, partial [Mesorhabditis spiculigera]
MPPAEEIGNGLLHDLHKLFGASCSEDDLESLFNTQYESKFLTIVEDRYEKTVNGNEQQFRDTTRAIRDQLPGEPGNTMIALILEGRKWGIRGGAASAMFTLSRNGTAAYPETPSINLLQGTRSYVTPPSNGSILDQKGSFDRNSRHRIGRTNSSLTQATPPVERRIPRPGDKQSHRSSNSISYVENQMFNRGTDLFDYRDNKMEGSRHKENDYRKRNYNPSSPQLMALPSEIKRTPQFEPVTRADQMVVGLDVMLQEVIHAMKGLNATHIRKNAQGVLGMSPYVAISLETWSSMQNFIEYGNLCLRLPRDPDNYDNQDLFKKAFQTAVFNQRLDFTHAVDIVGKQLGEEEPFAALLSLDRFDQDWREKMCTLHDVWVSLSGPDVPGYEVISSLLEQHAVALENSGRKMCLRALLDGVMPVYILQLSDWILHAKLNKEAGRWLVRAFDMAQDDIMGTYRLDKVPQRFRFFSDRYLANKILELGKLIKCLGGVDWAGWDEAAVKISGIRIEHLMDFQDNSLETLVQEMCIDAGRDVKRTLIERDRLYDHIELLSDVFMLAREPFSGHLFTSVRTCSAQFTRQISATEAASLLGRCILYGGLETSSSIKGNQFEVMAEIGSTPRSSLRQNYVNSLCPRYKGATRLAACVLSRDALLRYQGVFRAMWSVQFTYQGIVAVQTELMRWDRSFTRAYLKPIRDIRNAWSAYLSHVFSTVYALAHYQNSVCAKARTRLRAKLDEARDLGECIHHHDRHLSQLEDGLFLDAKLGTRVFAALGPLLDHAISMFITFIKFSAGLTGRADKWSDKIAAKPIKITDDTACFVQVERQLEFEEDMHLFEKYNFPQLKDLYAQFKHAQKTLYEVLNDYGDTEPMAGLRELLRPQRIGSTC